MKNNCCFLHKKYIIYTINIHRGKFVTKTITLLFPSAEVFLFSSILYKDWDNLRFPCCFTWSPTGLWHMSTGKCYDRSCMENNKKSYVNGKSTLGKIMS